MRGPIARISNQWPSKKGKPNIKIGTMRDRAPFVKAVPEC